MAQEYTPSVWLKHIRDEWRTSSSIRKISNRILLDLREGDKELRCWRLSIPNYIPAKYHNRIQSVWREMVINIAFKNSSKQTGYAERFKLSQKIK